MNKIPTDTILDDPTIRDPTISSEVIDHLKRIYLSFGGPQELSATEIINGMEQLRRQGIIELSVDREYENIKVKFTDLAYAAGIAGIVPPQSPLLPRPPRLKKRRLFRP